MGFGNWPFQLRLKDTWTLITSICPRLTAATAILNEHATLWKIFIILTDTERSVSSSLASRLMAKVDFQHVSINFPTVLVFSRQSSASVGNDERRIICLMWIFHYPQNKSYFIVERERQKGKTFTCRLVTHGNLSFLSCDPDGKNSILGSLEV